MYWKLGTGDSGSDCTMWSRIVSAQLEQQTSPTGRIVSSQTLASAVARLTKLTGHTMILLPRLGTHTEPKEHFPHSLLKHLSPWVPSISLRWACNAAVSSPTALHYEGGVNTRRREKERTFTQRFTSRGTVP